MVRKVWFLVGLIVSLLVLGVVVYFINPYKNTGGGFIGFKGGKSVPYTGFDVVCEKDIYGWGCYTLGDYQYSSFCKGSETECVTEISSKGLKVFSDHGYICQEIKATAGMSDKAFTCILVK